MSDEKDPYTDVFCGPVGENVLVIGEDGSTTFKRKEPEETNNRPKGAAKRAIEQCPDELIELTTTSDLGTYYMMMKKTTVRHSGPHWLCLTCTDSTRYETADHKGCVHIQRLKKYVADHPEQQVAA
jgi:ferredoxin